jgi:hypothetical protein
MDVTLKFIANAEQCLTDESLRPVPAQNVLPEWYRKAKVLAEGVTKDNLVEYKRVGLDTPVTFKSCMPFADAMTSGYLFTLPCDIEIISTNNGCTIVVSDESLKQFVDIRPPMSGFHHPEGYYESHFHWHTMWGVEAPYGWSVMFTQPLNRYDLPFLTTSGIVDSDMSHVSGRIPFFVKKGYNGVLPKGTPFIQLIPIQRANWKSEIDLVPRDQQLIKSSISQSVYRPKEFPFYGAYKKLKWARKNYN